MAPRAARPNPTPASVEEPAVLGYFDLRGAAARLLGGRRILHVAVNTPLQVHKVLERGLPAQSLGHLEQAVSVLGPADVHRAIGLSTRTIQRFRSAPFRALSPEQSGRAWKFAEVLARATDVLGTQTAAETWLDTPALALDGKRPLDLLATPVGTELVERLLGRIEHGVYT
ncbi:MAG: hypothetical protein RLZZ200_388 [Pseudomonadota bacterium]|jgi:putative toxin-antitoxin system antitoxin component (TIGR02293 family)